jgi:hypothetical protein
MRILAAVLAVPAAVLAWQWWQDTATERRLAPVASQIAGRDVAVDCQTLWGALIDPLPRHGEVLFDRNGIPEPRIFLTHETCDRLAGYVGGGGDGDGRDDLACLASARWSVDTGGPFGDPCYASTSDTIYALLTLAHEAYHTAGVFDEAITNCYATQALGYAARELGGRDDEARALARAMAELLPFQGGAYRTRECVAGSRLDLHPETPTFPTEEPIVPPHGRGGLRGLAAAA